MTVDRLLRRHGRQGHLHGGAVRQGNRDRVAAWITDAGITATVEGFARTEEILKLYRSGSDCLFELVLTMDAADRGDRGIVFREKYEYLPQAGDAGREYSYSVTTPYTSFPALVADLATSPGERGPRRTPDTMLQSTWSRPVNSPGPRYRGSTGPRRSPLRPSRRSRHHRLLVLDQQRHEPPRCYSALRPVTGRPAGGPGR